MSKGWEASEKSNAKWCADCGQEGLSMRAKMCSQCSSAKLIPYREEDVRHADSQPVLGRASG